MCVGEGGGAGVLDAVLAELSGQKVLGFRRV
jgi:hypothetical protein